MYASVCFVCNIHINLGSDVPCVCLFVTVVVCRVVILCMYMSMLLHSCYPVLYVCDVCCICLCCVFCVVDGICLSCVGGCVCMQYVHTHTYIYIYML